MYTVVMPQYGWSKDGSEQSAMAELMLENGNKLEVEIAHNPFEGAGYQIKQATIVNDDNEIVRYVNPHLIQLVEGEKPVTVYFDELWNTITAKEADELFGLQDGTARQACNRGDVPARKSGATWLISFDKAFERWGNRPSRAAKPSLSAHITSGGDIIVAQWDEEAGDYSGGSHVISASGDTATLRDLDSHYEWTAPVADIKAAITFEDQDWTFEQAIEALKS